MAMIDNDWLDAIQGEFKKPYYRELFQFVKEEYNKTTVYPPADDIFNALHFTPLKDVKVLVLGQDPYHNVNQAHGLSFSVPTSQKEIPPSFTFGQETLISSAAIPSDSASSFSAVSRYSSRLLPQILTITVAPRFRSPGR